MVTTRSLHEMKARAEKIAMLTCYDASFAHLLSASGVDVLLVGDSLGMVIKGNDSTLSVSLEDMLYHTAAVAKGNQGALLLSDLPFGSYQGSVFQAFEAAAALMAAGAHMVKLEGGAWIAPTVAFLVQRGIPVCAHIGLTPQSVHVLGGYRVQGKSEQAARVLRDDARALADAGADMVLMEAVPSALAAEITQDLKVPTIGIGAGVACDGQVLVLHDMLGVYPKKVAKFVRNFMEGATSIEEAVRAYVAAVKEGRFPSAKESF